jgi:hypothetical protein
VLWGVGMKGAIPLGIASGLLNLLPFLGLIASLALPLAAALTIFVVLLILWLLGFSLHIGGGLIHLLLVVGLVVLVINLLSGRRSAV